MARARIGILFEQFAPYHVDRCEAVAARCAGSAEVVAIEVANRSQTYAWAPSGAVRGALKRTLFPGRDYERIPPVARFWAQLKALARCDVALIGVGYDRPDIIALGFALGMMGRRPVLLSESKFDDKPRRLAREWVKRAALLPFRAAIVGGRRHVEYMRFLGFRRRPVLPGYDGVGLDRVRALGGPAAPGGPLYAERGFVFVGRFVAKKNLPTLLDGYASHVAAMGDAARPLTLVGGGEREGEIRGRIAKLGLEGRVTITGFAGASQVAGALSRALALVLPSTEEQWGLVVNEALAFSLPVVVSHAVGAGDALVGNLDNGFVVDRRSSEEIAQAMNALAGDEELWRRMVEASAKRAWLGDAERFADAVEAVLRPSPEAQARLKRFADASSQWAIGAEPGHG